MAGVAGRRGIYLEKPPHASARLLGLNSESVGGRPPCSLYAVLGKMMPSTLFATLHREISRCIAAGTILSFSHPTLKHSTHHDGLHLTRHAGPRFLRHS